MILAFFVREESRYDQLIMVNTIHNWSYQCSYEYDMNGHMKMT